MKRSELNLVIDSISLFCFACLASSGLVLYAVLPPGSGGGRHGGGSREIPRLLSLNRHEWGEVHSYIALAFLALLLVHIYLHFNWIRAMVWGTESDPRSNTVRAATCGMLAVLILVIVAPLLALI